MSRVRAANRGIVMYVVLVALLVVIVLTNIILTLVNSQSRLSHHEISRVQAYYAARAGMNWARENLRVNDPCWTSAGTFTRRICRQAGAPCGGCDLIDSEFPPPIREVQIIVGPAVTSGSPVNATRPVNVTVVYTYTP